MRQHCALKHGILKEFLAEFLGTFVLVVSRSSYSTVYMFVLFFFAMFYVFILL